MPPPKTRTGPRTVYSTGVGRLCPDCGQAKDQCCCRNSQGRVVGDGQVRVRRETKGRKGKTVSTISGLPVTEAELKELGTELKQLCGCGGAVKEGVIEIQGDHCDKLLQALIDRGYPAKRAGG
jgi:translation initiation factor 1